MKKQLFLLLTTALLISACSQKGTFTVDGNLTNAEGKKMFLVYNGLYKDSIMDSVTIAANGAFKFAAQSPEFPDFYMLKVENQQINLAIDSIENISINGDYNDILNVEIKNSPQSIDLQNIRKDVAQISADLAAARKITDATAQKIATDSIKKAVEKYKDIAKSYVLSDSHFSSAYFALFQQVDGLFFFSLSDKKDRPFFQALATRYNIKAPQYNRTKNLYTMVMMELAKVRESRKENEVLKNIDVKSSGFIDIKLKDKNGYYKQLSSYIGKPIVLDFSSYSSEKLKSYPYDLMELYDSIKDKGVTLFQVSLGDDKFFWEASVSNKPWVAVLDENLQAAQMYNITSIPTLFLLNAKGDIVGKYSNIKDLKVALEKLLK